MENEKRIEGNVFIFFIFQICNFGLAVLGVFTICISIYLISISRGFDAFNFFIMLFGIIYIILCYFGFKYRFSLRENFYYLLVLSWFFICNFILTILVFYFKDTVLNWVVENNKDSSLSINELRRVYSTNLDISNSFLVVVLLLFLLIVIFSWLYRRSLNERYEAHMPLNPETVDWRRAIKKINDTQMKMKELRTLNK